MGNKLRIGLIIQGSRQWTGGIEYTRNLIAAINSLPSAERTNVHLTLFIRGDVEEKFYSDLVGSVDDLVDCRQQRLKFFTTIKKQNIDFLYPYARRHNFFPNYAAAGWIPDFQHRYLPQYFAQAELAHRDALYSKMAKLNRAIVFSSKSAADDFAKFYPNAPAQSMVMRFRTSLPDSWFANDPNETVGRYHLPRRFFMVCNQFWGHKNHTRVLSALAKAGEEGFKPTVVFTGHPYDNRKPGFIDEILSQVQLSGLHEQVRLLGLIPRVDQIQLLRASIGVIQPSLFEGWSTVVEDAASIGKKIILSSLGVHKEQDPPGAVFFDPSSTDDLVAAMRAIDSSSSGFDAPAEIAARERNRNNIQLFGRRFLEIASDIAHKA